MLTRRTALTGIAATIGLLTPPAPVRAQPGPQAVTFVQITSGQLVTIVNSADSPQEKRRRLRQVVDATVDVDDIARFCLGRFWRIATDDQQAQYMALFHDLLVTNIASHLGEYQGVRVTMGLARTSTDTEIVITKSGRHASISFSSSASTASGPKWGWETAQSAPSAQPGTVSSSSH